MHLIYVTPTTGDVDVFLSAAWKNMSSVLTSLSPNFPWCGCPMVTTFFWTSDSFSTSFLLSSRAPLFWLSPKCFIEPLLRKEKMPGWLLRTTELLSVWQTNEESWERWAVLTNCEIFEQQMKRFLHSVWIPSIQTCVHRDNPLLLKFLLQK